MTDTALGATVSFTSGAYGNFVSFVFSDLHLSAGEMLEIRAPRAVRHIQPTVFVKNPLEDFHHDAAFAELLPNLVDAYGDADRVTLRMNGDCSDFHSVTWKGRISDPPFEFVAVAKMRTIIAGHPRFYRAIRTFLLQSEKHFVVWTPGNHDLHKCWPGVQRVIIDELSQGDPEIAGRIRFADHTVDFREFENGVLYEHGNQAEPHNWIDPKNVIITHHLGKVLKQPILNQPLGSIMTLSLVLPLKLRNDLVGRVPEEKHLWIHAAFHRWLWALYAALALTRALLHNNMFAFWDWRRKASLRAQIAVVRGSANQGFEKVNEYARGLLLVPIIIDGVAHKVRAVCVGHSHGPVRESTPDGTYINTGHWSERKSITYPTFEPKWTHSRWVERSWWAFRHYLTRSQSFADRLSQLGKLLTVLAFAVAAAAFFATSYDIGERWLTFGVFTYQVVAAVLAAMMLGVAVFRVLAVHPIIKDDTLLTFGLFRHGSDGALRADLKRFLPENPEGQKMVDFV